MLLARKFLAMMSKAEMVEQEVGRIPARASVAHEDHAYPGLVLHHSLDDFNKTVDLCEAWLQEAEGIDDRCHEPVKSASFCSPATPI